MSRTPPSARLAPPGLGEHTDQVLARAGYTEQEIVDLRDGRIVQ
jgi:crotonobetainyl-CoA:carnitine CoA-transferase CaiB-like acyl-CoA transferase